MANRTIDLGQVLNDSSYTRNQINKNAPETTFQYFEDFVGQAVAGTEADSVWIFHNGSDVPAIDPAINVQEGGVIRLTAGTGDGVFATDNSQMVMHLPWQADSGGLAFECRVKITDVSECSLYVGFTDITTADEEPFSVSAAAITSNCDNGAGFVYDTAMTTPAYWAVGTDTTVDATGSGTTGIVPTDAAYNILRMEIDADGEGASAYIDDVLVGTLTASVCAASTNLYFTVAANGNGTNAAAATVDVDYILIERTR